MKKRLLEKVMDVTTVLLLLISAYNICSARLGMELYEYIGVRYDVLCETYQERNIEDDMVLNEDMLTESLMELPHEHEWYLSTEYSWVSTGNGKGHLVIEDVYICECGKEKE